MTTKEVLSREVIGNSKIFYSITSGKTEIKYTYYAKFEGKPHKLFELKTQPERLENIALAVLEEFRSKPLDAMDTILMMNGLKNNSNIT